MCELRLRAHHALPNLTRILVLACCSPRLFTLFCWLERSCRSAVAVLGSVIACGVPKDVALNLGTQDYGSRCARQ